MGGTRGLKQPGMFLVWDECRLGCPSAPDLRAAGCLHHSRAQLSVWRAEALRNAKIVNVGVSWGGFLEEEVGMHGA